MTMTIKRAAIIAAILATITASAGAAPTMHAATSCDETAHNSIRFTLWSNGHRMGYWHTYVAVRYRSGRVCEGKVRAWFSPTRPTTWHVTYSQWTFQRWNGINYVYGPPYDYALFRNVAWLHRRDGRACRFLSDYMIDAYGNMGVVVWPDQKIRRCQGGA